MKRLCDVNVLLALVAERCKQHAAVKVWWNALPAREVVFVCRFVQMGLLRLLCTKAVMGKDTVTLPRAWSIYACLIESGRFAFVMEPARLDLTWMSLCLPFAESPTVVMDAYLAAFALAGGYRLATLDRGFRQFDGLECEWIFP